MKADYLKALRPVILVASLAALAACSSNPISRVWDRDKSDETVEETAEKKEDDNRVAVLALEQDLIPDEEMAGVEVKLPPAFVNASWPQPGGDADHTMHHLGAALTLQKVWTTDIGAGSSKRSPLLAPPIVADGRVFVTDSKATISAYDAKSGQRIWRTALTPDVSEKKKWYQVVGKVNPAEIGFGGGVAFDNGRVFVTSGFGFVAALNAEDGALIWQKETLAPVRTAPTATSGRVYAVTNANEFLAYNQETGEIEWDFQSFEEAARFLTATSPAANDDVVIAPFSSGEVTALRADNGRQLWTQTIARSSRMTALSNLNDIAGSPVIDRGVVYAISHAGQMSAVDLRSGNSVWETTISGLQTPWVAGEFIFVISVDGEVVCLARDTGKIAWVKQLPRYENEKKKKNRISWTGPVIAGGNMILASSRGEILLLDPGNGEINQREKVGKGTIVTPVIADEQLYILSENGKLSAFR